MEYYPRLLKEYREKLLFELKDKLKLKNTMEVPRLEKIIVNMGVGEAIENSKILESAVEELRIITGQHPATARSRKAISNFKLRAGVPIGCFVTLRGWKMYEFLDRLISVAMPRIRDFRGISPSSFDGRGNYNMGVKDEHAYELLSSFGMPFRKKS